MSIQVIEGKTEHVVEYNLNFDIDSSGGYSFPCDENGNITEDMHPVAWENLKYCQEHPELYHRYIHKREYDIKEPNTGICHCGEKFWLGNEYMGACSCPNCGRWYNIWGQELLPPDQWEEDY